MVIWNNSCRIGCIRQDVSGGGWLWVCEVERKDIRDKKEWSHLLKLKGYERERERLIYFELRRSCSVGGIEENHEQRQSV